MERKRANPEAEQKWGAVCIERCKHGSGRGLRKPTVEIRQGDAFLLYYVGDGMMIHCAGNGVEYKSINTNYYKSHFYAFGRISG
jgi:hypothetical protein